MELLIAFAAVVLFVYSPKWRKFVLITAAVVSVVVGSLCAAAYYDSHRRLTVDEVLGPDISDLPPPPAAPDAPKH
jgi:4-hydroxybenzoate polyprenyltransferase